MLEARVKKCGAFPVGGRSKIHPIGVGGGGVSCACGVCVPVVGGTGREAERASSVIH
jgi:hypothetical protein